MSEPTTRSLIVAAGFVSLTWPLALGHACLRLVFSRPYVVNDATVIALPVSLVLALVATTLSFRYPPTETLSWVFRCTVFGAIMGTSWLATGTIAREQMAADAIGPALVGGLVYGAPIGSLAGAAFGTEMAAIERWVGRWGSTSHLRMLGIVMMSNAVVAGLLWIA